VSDFLEQLQHPARIAKNAVEVASRELTAAALVYDRTLVAELLRQAVAGLYLALDTRPEEAAHAEALHESAARIGDAERLVSRAAENSPLAATVHKPLAILADARKLLLEQAEKVTDEQLRLLSDPKRWAIASAHGDASSEVPPFRASLGVPHVHHLRRPRIPPAIDLGENPAPPPKAATSVSIPRPKTLEELAAFAKAAQDGSLAKKLLEEPEEPPAAPPPAEVIYAYEPAVEEREVLRALARDTLEDIGSLGNLRHPIPTETWLDQAPFEQRLLNNVDYFASLGAGVLGHVAIYHRESEVPDPMRAFALSFTLGCIEGRDLMGLVVSVLKQRPPEEWPGFVDGLTLAPNPAIDEVLPELLTHPNLGLVGLAVDVLGERGTLPKDVVGWVRGRENPDLDVRLSRALARNLDQETATLALEDLFRRSVDLGDDALFAATTRALLSRGHSPTREALRDELATRRSAARTLVGLELLGIAGHPDDLPFLLEAVQLLELPPPHVLRALGRYGHLALFPFLVDVLRRFEGEEAVVEAAGEALDRISAAGLRKKVEEPWETGLPPELQGAADAVGAPKPMRTVEKVILDPASWDAWAKEHLGELDTRKKHRGGEPFRPLFVIDELEAKTTPWKQRPDAAFEAACILGSLQGFRTDDWVATQQAKLAELRRDANSLDGAPGSWWFDRSPAPRDAWSWGPAKPLRTSKPPA